MHGPSAALTRSSALLVNSARRSQPAYLNINALGRSLPGQIGSLGRRPQAETLPCAQPVRIEIPIGFSSGIFMSLPSKEATNQNSGRAVEPLSLARCECPANDHFCRMARKAVSLRCPFGDQARAVDSTTLFKAPLFRLDGILGRVRAQILCTRLIDAEPLLRGSEEKALK
jgi:hypothetical protein